MKTLLLMRHAKASWKDTSLKDKQRPLTKKGKKNAAQMGELLKERELVPQLIVASSVERAKETAEEVVAQSGYQGKMLYLDKLFMAEPEVIFDVLKLFPEESECVLVIGHNPGLEGLLQRLTGKIHSLPPAAVAHVNIQANLWAELSKDTEAELIALWRIDDEGKPVEEEPRKPKDHKEKEHKDKK